MKNRIYYDKLYKERNDKKISVILGPRQVGKTTILKTLHSKLGGVFVDVDLFSEYEKVSSYEKLIDYLTINSYEKKQKDKFYLFLDEFQRYSNLTTIIKNVYDHHDNIKIYATGSSSLVIKNSIQESLAGRKLITYFYPLSFREFLLFKDKEDLIVKIDNLKKIKQTKDYHKLLPDVFGLLEEFLIYGGYPEVVLKNSKEEKLEILKSIFDLYIKKDLVDYLSADKILQTQTVVKLLAVNNGGIVNYSSLAEKVSVGIREIKEFINLIKETFLVLSLLPYFENKNKEIVKAPKIYFLDSGVANYFANNFNDLGLRADAGNLFESFVIAELIKGGEDVDSIKYYRTKMGTEVDIVLDRGAELIPIEVKHKTQTKSSDFSGLEYFINEYKTKRNFLVNLGEIGTGKKVKIIDCFNVVNRVN